MKVYSVSVKQVPPIIEFVFYTKIIYAEMKTTSSFIKGNQRFNGKRNSYGGLVYTYRRESIKIYKRYTKEAI